jgi:hypothetical protein
MEICPFHCGVERARNCTQQPQIASLFRDGSDKPRAYLMGVFPHNGHPAVAVAAGEESEKLFVWHCFHRNSMDCNN